MYNVKKFPPPLSPLGGGQIFFKFDIFKIDKLCREVVILTELRNFFRSNTALVWDLKQSIFEIISYNFNFDSRFSANRRVLRGKSVTLR